MLRIILSFLRIIVPHPFNSRTLNKIPLFRLNIVLKIVKVKLSNKKKGDEDSILKRITVLKTSVETTFYTNPQESIDIFKLEKCYIYKFIVPVIVSLFIVVV